MPIIPAPDLDAFELESLRLTLEALEGNEPEEALRCCCHEGLKVEQIGDHQWKAALCSKDAYGETREEAVERLRLEVVRAIREEGWLGC